MEMERVPAAGYEIKGLPVSGFDRKHLLRNIKVLYRLQQSLHIASGIVRDFKPHIAIGVGGFASGPVLKVAQRHGIPTLLQEQNSYAGVTNKLLAKKADCICVAYEGMERFFPADRIVLTGNPVRRGLLECGATRQEARASFGLDPDKLTILIIGGSLGARTINSSIIAGLGLIADHADDVQVIWQSGKMYDERCREALASSGATNVIQIPFVSHMDMAYRAADLVVSRAGASSISEIQLLGKPSILVPSPNVAEDHQTKNTLALTTRDAAVYVKDAEAVRTLIPRALNAVADDALLAKLSKNIKTLAHPDAARIIAREVIKLAEEK